MKLAFLLSILFSLPSVHASDDLFDHRVATLSRLLEPNPESNGRVPYDRILTLEILEDWARTDDASKPANLASQMEDVDQSHALRRLLIDNRYEFPVTDERMRKIIAACERRWSRLLDQVHPYPWSTLEWTRVFAPHLARAELRVKERFNLTTAQIYAFTEHVIPTAEGYGVLMRTLSDEYADGVAPVYSDELLTALIEEMKPVSPSLAASIKKRAFEPDWESATHSLVDVSGFMRIQQSNSHSFKFFFTNRRGRTLERRRPISDELRDYRLGLAHVKRVRQNATALRPSALREFILARAQNIIADLNRELASYPARAEDDLKYQRKDIRYWDDPRWWRVDDPAGADQVAIEWSNTLRAHGLPEAAELNDAESCRRALAGSSVGDQIL